MKALWNKAKKEATILSSTAQKAIGVKKDVEDPDFLERETKLSQIESSAKTLLQLLEQLAGQFTAIGRASETAREALKDPDAPKVPMVQITATFVESQLTEQCIQPVRDFSEHMQVLQQIKRKRHRNRELMQSGGSDEARRTEKYNKYHSAFVRGVDLLGQKHVTLMAVVFARQSYFMREYAYTVRSNVG
jgi:hypothetical protein